MDATCVILMLVTAVASRSVPKPTPTSTPKPDFVPSLELLDSIFKSPPPASEKPEEIPLEVTPESDDTIASEKKDNNVGETKGNVEVNVEIHVGADCGKDEVSIRENIKVNGNGNTTKAGDGKQTKPKKGNVKVTTRFVDRVAFGADSCAVGMVRVGKTCSPED